MTNTIHVFDFDIDANGARVVPCREPLHARCIDSGEIDENIRQLKADLDAVAVRMKVAVREQLPKLQTLR
jgi:hypothetical protein